MRAKPPKPPKPDGYPNAPRIRDKKKKPSTSDAGNPRPPLIQTDASHLSDDVPADVKIAFAEMVMTYSAMEATVEGLIWDITGISYDDGKLMTKMDLSNKVTLLRSLIERYGLIVHYRRQTTVDMWKAVQDLMPLRNLAVHGMLGCCRFCGHRDRVFSMKPEVGNAATEVWA